MAAVSPPLHIAALRPLALNGIALGAVISIADLDLWGHLRFGLDTLATGSVTAATDPYSFTQDKPWLNHEWLSELVTAVAYQTAGPLGLFGLKALLAVFLGWLVWTHVRHTPFRWRWGAMAVAAWGVIPLLITLRPQIWSGIGIGIVCCTLTASHPALIWTLPAVFAVWANLHGGWIVGGGVLALWTAGAWLQKHPRRWQLLAAGLCSLCATLINPEGWGLWKFLLETVRLGRENIIEWQPIWVVGIIPVTLWLFAAGFVAVSLRRWGRPPLPTLLPVLFLAVTSMQVIRLLPLFTIAAVALLGTHWPREKGTEPPASRAMMMMDGCIVSLAVLTMLWFRGGPGCLPLPDAIDTIAAESLRGTRGRLVTHFNYGEYALWHFGPALQVSIDGRRETVYSQKVLEEQVAIAQGTEPGLTALARIKPEYVWLPSSSSATAAWLGAHDYRVDVRTERSFIATRRDRTRLARWSGISSGCFPGP